MSHSSSGWGRDPGAPGHDSVVPLEPLVLVAGGHLARHGYVHLDPVEFFTHDTESMQFAEQNPFKHSTFSPGIRKSQNICSTGGNNSGVTWAGRAGTVQGPCRHTGCILSLTPCSSGVYILSRAQRLRKTAPAWNHWHVCSGLSTACMHAHVCMLMYVHTWVTYMGTQT